MAKKIVLSHSSLAQLAAGVPIAQVEHQEVEEEELNGAAAEAAAGGKAGAEPGAEASAETGASAGMEEGGEPAEGQEPKAQTVPEMVAFLKAELAEARKDVAKHQMENMQLQGKVDGMEADVAGLLKVAMDGVVRLQVMLGQTPSSLSGLPATAVTAQYMTLKKTFEERFHVGRHSLSGEEAATGSEEPLTGDAAAIRAGIRLVPQPK